MSSSPDQTIEHPDAELRRLSDACKICAKSNPTEYESYGVITEAFTMHKSPLSRFLLFPQLRIPRKRSSPKEAIILDFGFGKYIEESNLHLGGGAEVKRGLMEMQDFPSADKIQEIRDVHMTLSTAHTQAEDQAKSAMQHGYMPNAVTPWLLFCGLYCTKVYIGPFTQPQLYTRSNRRTDSGDWEVTEANEWDRRNSRVYEVNKLGTKTAFAVIEEFFRETADVHL